MEKLLSEQHKIKTNNASKLTSHRTKKYFLKHQRLRKYFCHHTSEKHFNQPYSGCFTLVN